MDSASEDLLWKGLATLKDKTMMIISHNLKVLEIVDKVLFIEHGKVKFYGNKEDFIRLANGAKRREAEMNLLHKIKHLFSISLVMVKNIAHVLFSTLLTVSKSIEYYVRDLGLFIARAFFRSVIKIC